MQQSKSLLTENSSTTDNPTVNVDKLLSHWTWELYSYTFATLFGVLALSCFVAFVRQCTQPSLSRNIYGRFTTVQLFLAATLQVVSKLWNPILLQDASMATFIASLILKSFTMALILSAFSILLLLMLETTKTSLGAPRLQNIWVLLGITAAFTAIMLTFNLLGLYGNREIWFFVSHLALFIWGILICVGYSVAGYRMWRNLKSSRQERHSAGEGRLKHIIGQLFTSAFVTAAVDDTGHFLGCQWVRDLCRPRHNRRNNMVEICHYISKNRLSIRGYGLDFCNCRTNKIPK